MTRASIARWTVVVVGVVAVAGLVVAQFWSDQRKRLDGSIAHLLTHTLNTTYSIERQKLDDHEIDTGGHWWVRIAEEPASLIERLPRLGFGIGDDADETYYKREMSEALEPGVNLSAYRVFRAELALGKGSICEILTCNIDILIGPNDHDVFVAISKI